jgi:hypothetical protein
MSQQELLRKVIPVLNALHVEYMLTGSLASSAQGEPRSTHDIDLVVLVPPEAIRKLVEAFPPPEFYLSEEAIRDAVRHRSMFNLLSISDGEKVDFWVLKDEPFDQSCFSRKRVENILGMELNVSAPEDTMLAKLRWARLAGGSEKQFTDVLRVYEVQRPRLDLAYLNQWATQIGVEDLWKEVQDKAKPAGE